MILPNGKGMRSEKASFPLHSEIWIASVVPDQRHADAIGQLAVDKVVWEPFQIRAMEAQFPTGSRMRRRSRPDHRRFRYQRLANETGFG